MKTNVYQTELKKLNPEQRQAVELIDGQVMVLAGPGTGKTQVVALRIATILLQTDVNARSILALTFTESGVKAMRERLVGLIGPAAYQVAIYTFHGFANRVINESGIEFYKNHTLEQIDDIGQFHVISKILDGGSFPILRSVRSPYYYVSSIISAIKSLKNENVTPQSLRNLAQETITTLTDNPESIAKTGKNKGQLKQSVVTKLTQQQKNLELAEVYEAYQLELDRSGRYDYEDMILFVLDKFRANSDLLASYQERFLYILVDEYQDTNNAQNMLVKLLTEGVESPNIFVVGDDKQSIYRFQGASTANIINFKSWYPQATVISLVQNYRSGQPILDVAHSLISYNTTQLGNSSNFKTKLVAQTPRATVAVTSYSSPDQEALGVISSIEREIKSGTAPSEIAIIYRKNREAEALANLLARKGIPFVLEAGVDVLADSDVRQLINLLHVTHNPDDNEAVFRYLHASYSPVTSLDLILFNRSESGESESQFERLTSPKLEKLAVDKESFFQAKTNIETWHAHAGTHSLADTVEFILNHSGLLASIVQQSDSLERLNRLRSFYDDVKRLTIDEPDSGLTALFNRIDLRQRYHINLIASPLVESHIGAIRLMTAHKSKGLEFTSVYIPNCIEGNWSNGQTRTTIQLPEGIVPTVTSSEEIEEERRLFYVALTRAKQRLQISYANYSESAKPLTPSQFIAELGDGISLQTPDSIESPVTFFTPIKPDFVTESSRLVLQEIVQNQPLSPTSINTFLTCPAEYCYKHVYRVPGVRQPAQAYGTAIHRALEEWGKWRKGGRAFTPADVLKIFDSSLYDQGLTKRERETFAHLGHTVLNQYLEKVDASLPAPLAVEYSFGPHQVLLNQSVPITGKLDAIEPIAGSNKVRVIDYKTGSVRSRNEIEGKTESSDGDYKRQLVFYSLLAESDPSFPYTIGEVELRFIDDDCKFTTETFVITPEERRELASLIESIYGEITALNFHHTPHKFKFGQGESLCDILGPL